MIARFRDESGLMYAEMRNCEKWPILSQIITHSIEVNCESPSVIRKYKSVEDRIMNFGSLDVFYWKNSTVSILEE